MEYTILKATVTAKIWGTKNSWSLAPNSEADKRSPTAVSVALTVEGNDKDGYNLVMNPDGFFTADHWYESEDDARASAAELFDASQIEWSRASPAVP